MTLTRLNNLKKTTAGNAFIIILAAVFLFGALIFTFTRSGQKGTGNLSKGQAKIAAQEILNYSLLVEGAVNAVRIKTCSENEINFDTPTLGGYTNTDAPINNHCDIFNNNGGKITFDSAQPNWTNSGNDWSFNAEFQVTDIGTTCAAASCADLAINLQDVQTITCEEINRLVFDNATIPTDSTFDFTAFTGTFLSPTDIADEVGSAVLEGQSTGCFFSTETSQNIFYHVLLAR